MKNEFQIDSLSFHELLEFLGVAHSSIVAVFPQSKTKHKLVELHVSSVTYRRTRQISEAKVHFRFWKHSRLEILTQWNNFVIPLNSIIILLRQFSFVVSGSSIWWAEIKDTMNLCLDKHLAMGEEPIAALIITIVLKNYSNNNNKCSAHQRWGQWTHFSNVGNPTQPVTTKQAERKVK